MATFDQRDQDVTTQQNAGRDIHNIHIDARATPRGGLDSHKLAFLRAVASAMHLAHVTELAADQVNEVAALLQIPLQEVPFLLTRLQKEGLVRLHWGGRVALTSEGRAQAEGTAPSGPPGTVRIGDIGAGAQVVFGSPGAVVGPSAMGTGAIRVDLGLGDLAAALEALQRAHEGLSPEVQATTQELAGEVAAIVHETQQPQPDKPGLATRLDQVTSLMTMLGNVAEATQKLGPTLTLLGTALEVVRRWVLGG
jgi:hypothetical protein